MINHKVLTAQTPIFVIIVVFFFSTFYTIYIQKLVLQKEEVNQRLFVSKFLEKMLDIEILYKLKIIFRK